MPLEGTTGLAALVVTSRDRLDLAAVAVESFVTFHPEAPVAVVVVDQLRGATVDIADSVEQLDARALDLRPDRRRDLLAVHGVARARTALVPWGVSALLDRGHRRVLSLPDDACTYRRLDDFVELADGDGVSVVPRVAVPLDDDGCWPSSSDLAREGFHDPDLISWPSTLGARRLLRWRKQQLLRSCDEGRTDAGDRPLPSFDVGLSWFGAHPTPDLGLGLSAWNRHERDVRPGPAGLEVGGWPLRTVRFDGEPAHDHARPPASTHLADLAAEHAARVAAVSAGR
ncbi:hypothetical protein [Actinomarinicola tropica]|uniref:Glycosyltransferase family 2 protein n=1 Tax=Actinomarinicola tropica TaxID=2789776 RepID=A0A5Q2RN02_9ACTN|nr:hypothetical protein [Actinomarinicola tropica]QGG96322.1 hypothetical protein GH723_15130 [Actinomarinicola tropica]